MKLQQWYRINQNLRNLKLLYEIKIIFKELVEKNERYDLDEIEFWFENEGSWKIKGPRVRITNLANYVQDKYQQTAHLRIISDDALWLLSF